MAVSLHINMTSRGTSPHRTVDSCPDSVLLYSRLSAMLFLCLIGAIRNPFWVTSLMKRFLRKKHINSKLSSNETKTFGQAAARYLSRTLSAET